MRKVIIGISISHNSSACVVDDTGAVIFASAEERFSRKKNETGFPELTLDYILKNVVLKAEVSAVVVGDNCLATYASPQFAEFLYMNDLRSKDKVFGHPLRAAKLLGAEALARMVVPIKTDYRALVKKRVQHFFPGVTTTYLDHHLAHAASAYYCSPFDQALVITLDGSGNKASGLVLNGSGHTLKETYRLPENHSVGNYYKSLVSLLNFMPGTHEGKITGLAAFGDSSRFYDKFKKVLFLEKTPNGEVTFRSVCADVTNHGFALSDIHPWKLLNNHLADYAKSSGWDEFRRRGLQRYFAKMYLDVAGLNIEQIKTFQDRADLAAAGQAVFEDVIIEYIKHQIKKSSAKNLAVAGGVFANVKLNQKILEQTSIESMYIHPGMGDEGLSVGAAKFRHHHERKCPPVYLDNIYIGAKFDGGETKGALGVPNSIEAILKKNCVHYVDLNEQQRCAETVRALREEKIVAIFSSATEYGPRALGNRTILVNPQKKEVNDIVNRKLHRTEFMPFAPVILEEDLSEVFELPKLNQGTMATRFMTMTYSVKDIYREKMPAVVHIDGTARPQTIRFADNSFYHTVLKEFKDQTGIPALVNTSFNMHEEPIVNSPEDAVRAFLEGAIDHLVLENFWCSRENSQSPSN
jgi:carbamoyltransferase